MTFQPAYTKLLEKSKFEKKLSQAEQMLRCCVCCGWECRVDRTSGKVGVCNKGIRARVSSYGPHPGEEKPLSGWLGSGTVFFTGCNLRCQFCQNSDISQTDSGNEIAPASLAAMFLYLQRIGCHNINLVSPTHVVPQIIQSIYLAAQDGLSLPIVYNTGGYDSPEALDLLDGIVDIYMPDMKYADAQVARRYSRIRDYPSVNQTAVLVMHRQVGDLVLDEHGIAQRGLLIRHLVLPNGLAGTKKIVQFVAQRVSPDTYLNLMDQYRPAYRAAGYPLINRRISQDEFKMAYQSAVEAGLTRLDPIQWLTR